MTTFRIRFGVLMLSLGAMAALAPDASAQDEGTMNSVPHRHALTANPFLLLAEWFNAEYEGKISESATLGAAGSFISLDDGEDDFLSFNAQLRFYPQGAALVGFYVGPRLGYYRVDTLGSSSEDALGIGFDVGYNWLLGADRNFVVGLGVGLSRLLGIDDDVSAAIPTVRLVNLGWAF